MNPERHRMREELRTSYGSKQGYSAGDEDRVDDVAEWVLEQDDVVFRMFAAGGEPSDVVPAMFHRMKGPFLREYKDRHGFGRTAEAFEGVPVIGWLVLKFVTSYLLECLMEWLWKRYGPSGSPA